MTPLELTHELEALGRAFARSLGQRAAELRAWWERRDDRRGLWRATHSLVGSAPTFGFHEVGEAARALERRLGALGDDEWVDERVEAALAHLVAAAAAVSSGGDE